MKKHENWKFSTTDAEFFLNSWVRSSIQYIGSYIQYIGSYIQYNIFNIIYNMYLTS